MSEYAGMSFIMPTPGGGEVTAVVLSCIKWGNDRYAVVGYQQQQYPNVFLWNWNLVEQLLESRVEEDDD